MKMRYPRLATTLAIVVCGLWAPAVQANGISFENFSSSNTVQAFGGSTSMMSPIMGRGTGDSSNSKELLYRMMALDIEKLLPLLMMARRV
ncbi:hypothetical protein DR66_4148 [Delftia acidovorans]|uniref:hypothetical protein n=1 Tax=Delftia TaxID=80865 RepID=UPI0005080AAD|nr:MULTISPECIES: hypothetical protein [Delftia]KFJ12950.1 hypothetical protein DR66_4148 [Delftia acidovorans]QQB53477.1 hypothetical protein I6H54_15030 [Delftia acidovorans]